MQRRAVVMPNQARLVSAWDDRARMEIDVRVLVTGGAGYIGSHTCKALRLAGHEPVVYDNLSAGHEWAVKWGALEVGDINDTAAVTSAFSRHGCQAVMHFAAHAYVGESVTDPLKYYRNNVAGSISLISATLQAGIKKFVFSSSCAVYGVPDKLPIAESSPQVPVNPYGQSKLMVERILQDVSLAHGLNATALRYFNAAGADPDGEIGEDHVPETHLIPLVLRAARPAGAPVSVFGTDYPTADGTGIRDYVHVSDLAQAHVRALEVLDERSGFNAYNLGTGEGHSVNEIIEAARRLTNSPVNVARGPRRIGDPPELVANPARAREALAWSAKQSTLDQMMSSAWRWECRHRSSG